MYNGWKPPDELYHYGVLGMRWGVRKVRSSSNTMKKLVKRQTMLSLAAQTGKVDYDQLRRASDITNKRMWEASVKGNTAKKQLEAKSTSKLQKLNARYQKKQAKADRKFERAESKAGSIFTSKKSAERAFAKASKSQYKANKAAARGKKWYEHMQKAYKSTGLEMSESNREIGENFVNQVRMHSQAMYAASYRR